MSELNHSRTVLERLSLLPQDAIYMPHDDAQRLKNTLAEFKNDDEPLNICEYMRIATGPEVVIDKYLCKYNGIRSMNGNSVAYPNTIPTGSAVITRISCPVAILRGGGRHAAVVWEHIESAYEMIFLWDDVVNEDAIHPHLRELPRFQPSLAKNGRFDCYVAIGSPNLRKKLVESVKQLFQSQDAGQVFFPSLIHKSAIVSASAQIGDGCFVGPLALINTNARIGDFCLVNSAALVEHDCILCDFATLNPGAIMLGGAVLGKLTTLGANAAVREKRSVMAEATIGMGATVVHDIKVPIHGFWAGVPARPVARPLSQTTSNTIRWCLRKAFSAQRFNNYLFESLERGHLTNDGPLQNVLQSKVRNLVRSNRRVLLSCNGTAGLHALVAGLEIKRGKRIRWVTQAFTFPSSIQGPLADAIVCDIDVNLGGPCMEFLNGRTADFDGIIVTNVFGLQTEVLVYEQWCIDHGKLLIFDNAATPLGVANDGRSIHDIGDGAFISFHETKPFGRGEGGAIFVSDDVAPFVHQAMNFGYNIPSQVRIPNRYSSNWRMSDFAAAVICDHIDTINSEKWEEKLDEFTRFAVTELDRQGYRLAFPIRYPTVLSCLFVDIGGNAAADATCRKLNSHGVEAKHYYCPLVGVSEAPNAWRLYDRTVCMPFHMGMSKEDLVQMISLL